MQQRHVTHVATGEGRTVHMVGDTYRFLATGETTDGRLTVFEAIVPPGGGPPRHIHLNEREFYFILDGEFEVTTPDGPFVARAGTFVNIPKGAVHTFRNVGEEPARMLTIFTPAGVEGLFFTAGQPATPGSSAPPPDAAELERVRAAAPAYGVLPAPRA